MFFNSFIFFIFLALVLPPVTLRILDRLRDDRRHLVVLTGVTGTRFHRPALDTGLPLLNLHASLRAMKDEGVDPYYWPVTDSQGHWNHAAHVVIGRTLAEHILREGLLAP